MAPKRESPAVAAGLSVGSRRTDTPISEQLQHLAARHHVRPALLAIVADAAFGGGHG